MIKANLRNLLVGLILFSAPLFGCGKKESGGTPETPAGVKGNIYVSASGNDQSNGDAKHPVRTIGRGLMLVKPGDTVLVRAGTYTEKINLPKSGNSGQYVNLMSFPGEHAVISGAGLTVNGNEALVTMDNVSWIRIEGFDICNFKTYNAWANVDGVVIKGGSNNIILRGNRVFSIENNATPEQGRSAHGILVIGNTSTVVTKILIENNEIFDCNTGYSENVTVNGYVDDFIIRNNKVYNGENIGIVAAGGYAANTDPSRNYARNGVISGNEVYHILGSSGPIPTYQGHYGAPAIYVDGARNIVVDGNKVHDNDRGIGIMSENAGFPTASCIVRNNFVYNNYTSGIYLGGYEGQDGGGGTNNCSFVNNTLFCNNRELGYYGEVEGEIRLKQGCTGNTFRNNVIYARADRGVFINKENTGGTGNNFGYNLYYSAGSYRWVWDTVPYSDFGAWSVAAGGDDHSVTGADPLLISTSLPDLHLQSTSPAKNTGTFISDAVNGGEDIDHEARVDGGAIDKGADEVINH